MKNDIRQMIKTVIEEDAVNFKDHTSKVLYEKVGQKLEEQYKIEQLVQNTDWADAAEQIWAHRYEWMPLRGWYAQAHWKAKYFGLERPWY